MPVCTDVARIRSILHIDPGWSVYALGDLAPELFRQCTWRVHDREPALTLLYKGFQPPVFFALGDPAPVVELDQEAGVAEMFLHVPPAVAQALEKRYVLRDEALMWRMLLDPARFPSGGSGEAVRLRPRDVPALERLFADGRERGETPHFFMPSMVEHGVFLGFFEEEELVATAGTHLVVPAEGVAAIGNVYTRRDHRGRGLATLLTRGVAQELLNLGIETIALNVNQGNSAAIHIYEKLGFGRHVPFVEAIAKQADG